MKYAKNSNVLNRVGFNGIVKIFKLCGINLSQDPRAAVTTSKLSINYCIVVSYVILGLFLCSTDCYLMEMTAEVFGSFDLSYLSFVLSFTIFELGCLITYVDCVVSIKKYHSFLWNLAAIIDQVQPREKRRQLIKKTKKRLLIAMIVTTLYICSFIVGKTWMMKVELLGLKYRLPSHYIYSYHGFIIIKIVWTLTLETFSVFYCYSLIVFCITITDCFDCYLPNSSSNSSNRSSLVIHSLNTSPKFPSMSLSHHMYYHQQLVKLVREANSIFGPFLFYTFIVEASIILGNTRGYQVVLATQAASEYISIGLSIWRIAHFILKTIACSTLNDKVGC